MSPGCGGDVTTPGFRAVACVRARVSLWRAVAYIAERLARANALIRSTVSSV
jgi:hypothetical protein